MALPAWAAEAPESSGGADSEKKEAARHVRLHLECLPFGVSWEHIALDPDFAKGPGGEALYWNKTRIAAGLASGVGFGLGVAYSSDRRAAIGLRLFFNVQWSKTVKVDEDGAVDNLNEDVFHKVFEYAVYPFVEGAFGDGPVRPFFLVMVGIEGHTGRISYWPSDDDGYIEKSVHLGLGLGGGARLLLGDRASIDLTLLGRFNVGKLYDDADSFDDGIGGDTKFDHTILRLRADLLLGLSVWF